MTTVVERMDDGTWWGGTDYGRYIIWNRIYEGEAAEVLDLLFLEKEF